MLAATVAKLSKVSKIKKFDDVLSDLKQTGKFVKNSDIVIKNPTNKTIIVSAFNSEKILSNTSSINSKIVKNPYDILKQHNVPTTLNDSSIKALDSVKFSAKYDIPKSNKFTNPFESGTGVTMLYHSADKNVVDLIKENCFRIDLPNPQAAFHNNRFGRGVYLAESPATALAERPGGAIIEVDAMLGKNLNVTSRGIVDYDMAHSIARGARKHGFDSITFN
ncbi:MAG: hypothetical protein RR012_06610 [Oscillospiraceae bacterium]